MNAISKLSLAAVFAFSSAATAVAQEAGHGAHAHGTPTTQAGTAAQSGHEVGVGGRMAGGEVKKVDKESGKITIRHGELKDLGMPAMTMAFRAKDPAMLSQVKVGDMVKFMAAKVNGAITIVYLESAN